jgi:Ca2+-binding EF-hand superfamily protein
MPPSPPKGNPPRENYFYSSRDSARGGRGAAAARRASPGLLDEREVDVSRASQYFNNASHLMVQDNRTRKALERSYKSPASVVSLKPQKKAFELDEVHLKTLQTIFTLLDSDQDNMLDVDQLRTAIIAMGIPPSQRLIQEILRNVPDFKKAGGRGQVDFHTFKTVVTDRLKCNPVYMADIDELFKVFESTDGEGYISDHHLRHVMEVKTTNNTNLSDEEVDEIFKELRIERRAEVDYREFLGKISSGFVNFE